MKKILTLIKKRFTAAVLLMCMLLSLCACAGSESDVEDNDLYSRYMARATTDDGWVYTFYCTYPNNGDPPDTIWPYLFRAVNLKYRYGADKYSSTYQMLGLGSDEAARRDMDKISEILHYESLPALTREEMLAIDPESVSFEVLDRDMFFSLIKEALTGEPLDDSHCKYDCLLDDDLLTEPVYRDGCALQVGYASRAGAVDLLYIDVLYPTGKGARDYKQLSDMTKDGSATAEQRELWDTLSAIADGIVNNNDLRFKEREYKGKEIASLELSRLYKLLRSIESGETQRYTVEADTPESDSANGE